MTDPALPAGPPAGALLGRGWVRGPLWDAFWLQGGLWLAPLFWLLARGHDDPLRSPADGLYMALTLAFWIGHRISSTYLAYCTSAYRPLLRAQPVRFLGVPIAIAVLVFAILLPPDDALPLPRAQRVMALVILDYAFVTWHFAAQHYGVMSLYRLRAGQPRTPRARRLDRLYALGVGGALVFVAEVLTGSVAYQDLWVDRVVEPAWLDGAYATVRSVGAWTVAGAAAIVLALESRGPSPSLPRAAYVSGLAVMVLAAFHLPPFLFVALWTAQHWIAAMGLATVVAGADPPPAAPSRWYGGWHRVNRRPALLLVLLVVLSALLMPFLEVEAVNDAGEMYASRIVPALVEWLLSPAVAHVLLAVGLVTGFVHYALDRAVFRFSDPAIRQAARGLLEGAPGIGGAR